MERRRKTPMLPFVVLAAAIGLVAGYSLSLVLSAGEDNMVESPFGPDKGKRIPKGRDFSGVPEMDKLPKADQALYRACLQSGDSNSTSACLTGLDSLLQKYPNFCLGQGVVAVRRIESSRLSQTTQPANPLDSLPNDSATGESLASERALRSCLTQDSTLPYTQYAMGRWFESENNPDSAEVHYRNAFKSAPQFAYPYSAMGRMQFAAGDLRKAKQNFQMAIGLMESSPKSYATGEGLAIPQSEKIPFDFLAALYYQIGAEDSARMALEYGGEKGVHTDRMSLVQGLLWESRGFLGKADSLYRHLQAKDPDNPLYKEAIATLGWKPQPRATLSGRDSSAGAKTKDSEAIFAISLLDPIARQHSRNSPLWMALGQAYFRRGLFGMATECFDSSLKYDPGLPGLAEKRDAAYQNLIRQTLPARAATRPLASSALAGDEQTPVIIPGSIALLGTYSVAWGSTQTQVRQAYPKKTFQTLPNGNLTDTFLQEGVRHNYLLAFKAGRLWGIRVIVSDSAGVSGDLFGRTIRTKSKISGEGKGTGEAKCTGFKSFQGAIWENDDTFEFMAQFENEVHKVRMARIGREFLPRDRRLCDLVNFLREDSWK